MSPTASLILYCSLILLASLVGGWIPFMLKLTHKRLELAVSFVGGAMLGVGLLHMIPHALQMRMETSLGGGLSTGEIHHLAHALVNPVILWLLAGFLAMFFIERFFCYHHHEVPQPTGPIHSDQHRQAERCDHAHADKSHGHAGHRHKLTWAGAAIGLSLHSLIEGVALAASVEVGRAHLGDKGAAIIGFGTFLAIVLHKPFDSLTLGALMTVGGRSSSAKHLVNAGFAMLIPLGVLLFYLGLTAGDNQLIVSNALAFSAGTFLCIAMSDLLPELQFHQHDRGKLSAALLAGLAIAWLIGMVESNMHAHEDDHDHTHSGEHHQHHH